MHLSLKRLANTAPPPSIIVTERSAEEVGQLFPNITADNIFSNIVDAVHFVLTVHGRKTMLIDMLCNLPVMTAESTLAENEKNKVVVNSGKTLVIKKDLKLIGTELASIISDGAILVSRSSALLDLDNITLLKVTTKSSTSTSRGDPVLLLGGPSILKGCTIISEGVKSTTIGPTIISNNYIRMLDCTIDSGSSSIGIVLEFDIISSKYYSNENSACVWLARNRFSVPRAPESTTSLGYIKSCVRVELNPRPPTSIGLAALVNLIYDQLVINTNSAELNSNWQHDFEFKLADEQYFGCDCCDCYDCYDHAADDY